MVAKRGHREDNNESNRQEIVKTKKPGVGNKIAYRR